jgi:hypothetical protein
MDLKKVSLPELEGVEGGVDWGNVCTSACQYVCAIAADRLGGIGTSQTTRSDCENMCHEACGEHESKETKE